MPKNSPAIQIILIMISTFIILYLLKIIIDRYNRPRLNIPNIPQNTKESFDLNNSLIPNKSFTIYNFYNAKCPYSIEFDPIWKNLKNDFSNVKNLSFKEIDMSSPENERIMFYYGVDSSPTIILVSSDGKWEEYSKSRKLDLMKQYIAEKLNSNI
jgi:hypothetical protein